ncbi:hypothetical protein ACFX11_010614 [Malus domestica]
MAAAHQTTHLVTVNLFFYLVVSSSSANNVNGGGFSVELIRRNSPNSPFYNHNTSRPKSLSNRFRHLLEPSNPNIPQSEVRRDFDGEHLMKFSIGTPPVDIYGVADTGSTLIWTQCEPCIDCYKQKNPKFDPRKSSTYRNVSCGAQECNLLIDSGPNSCPSSSDHRQELCNYNYSYVDGATTIGLLAKETITLKAASGKPIPLQNIVFGCGHNNTGETFQENQMGVVGLGIGNMSFISQISPAVGGKKFSYCLVPSHANPTSTSKMSFGNGSEVLGEGVVSTRLISELDNNAYRVTLEGMSVGDKFVPFNSSGNGASPGNTILDSGTPNTYLPQQFYDPLVAELKKQIAMSPSEIMDPTFGTLVCYNNKNIFKGNKITVHFEGGAKLQLTPNQIFFYHQEFQNFCFAMQNSSYVTRDDFIVYGNYVQSNFWIGFDLERMVVSFKPTDCTNSSSSVIATPFSLSSTYVLNFLLFDDQKVCNYNYTYMDDSITQGVMSKETITFGSSSGKPVSFKDVVIGYGHNNTGKTFGENEMGIVGVGAGNLSIISQLAPYVGGKKFSHCLVPFDPDHPNDASIMSFGKGSEVSGEGVVSTPLITKHGKNQYFFTVEGISVGEQFVPFNSSGSVSKGNMYLDSGTQVTMLPQDFYGRLVEQVKKTMNSSLKPVEVNDESGTLLCYNTTENLKAP